MLPDMHVSTTTTGFHINSQLQSEIATGCVGQTWIQPERWCRGKTAAAREAGQSGSYYKGGDYLGGCSGGQVLHCRGSESDGVASWCHWVWMTCLPPAQRRQRWWRAGASGTGSPARQPLKRDEREKSKKKKACFFLGCVWAPKVMNWDNLIPLNNATTPSNKNIFQTPEIICNHLQLLSNSENSFTEVERVCACVCVYQWDWYVQHNQLHSNLGVRDCSHIFLVFCLCLLLPPDVPN